MSGNYKFIDGKHSLINSCNFVFKRDPCRFQLVLIKLLSEINLNLKSARESGNRSYRDYVKVGVSSLIRHYEGWLQGAA